jgi:H+/Cl- antiporter ClcA
MSASILWIRRQKRNFGFTQNVLFAVFSGLAVATIGLVLGDSVFGSGKALMTNFLFSADKASHLNTPILRVVGPILTFNSGGAGGIFAPSLSAGASLGSWISYVLDYSGTDANLFILCGMVSFSHGSYTHPVYICYPRA